MSTKKLEWDNIGEKLWETGIDKGVLYPMATDGTYPKGFAWNGLTGFSESPSGAEPNKSHANNTTYINIMSTEEFSGTLEAYMYPKEFAECDGTASPVKGLNIKQQVRKPFGFAYRTLIGNDIEQQDHGYKLHLIYGAMASPAERAYATIGDTPEALQLSWEIATTPVAVKGFRPTAAIEISSLENDAETMTKLEEALFGTDTVDAFLPLPADLIKLFPAPAQG